MFLEKRQECGDSRVHRVSQINWLAGLSQCFLSLQRTFKMNVQRSSTKLVSLLAKAFLASLYDSLADPPRTEVAQSLEGKGFFATQSNQLNKKNQGMWAHIHQA